MDWQWINLVSNNEMSKNWFINRIVCHKEKAPYSIINAYTLKIGKTGVW